MRSPGRYFTCSRVRVFLARVACSRARCSRKAFSASFLSCHEEEEGVSRVISSWAESTKRPPGDQSLPRAHCNGENPCTLASELWAAIIAMAACLGSIGDPLRNASQLERDECLEGRIKMPSPAVNLERTDRLWSCLQVDGWDMKFNGQLHHFVLLVDEASGYMRW